MVTPLGFLNRITRPPRAIMAAPPIGRCPVCHEEVRDPGEMLTLRGGIHVHRACASYRVRQRARAL
jgi:hypothetical protein